MFLPSVSHLRSNHQAKQIQEMASQESVPSKSNASASPTKKTSKQPKQTIESVLNDVSPFLGGNLSQKTVHQKISASDLTKAAATLMLQHYKVQDENILRTIALSM